MKRLHISINVTDLEKSIAFYSKLFDQAPAMTKPDYAKWLVDDPRVNFVIEKAETSGLTHAGIEADSGDVLARLFEQFRAAGPYEHEGETNCCYHQSEKGWTMDPDGLPWEAFHTSGQTAERGEGRMPAADDTGRGVCC